MHEGCLGKNERVTEERRWSFKGNGTRRERVRNGEKDKRGRIKEGKIRKGVWKEEGAGGGEGHEMCG